MKTTTTQRIDSFAVPSFMVLYRQLFSNPPRDINHALLLLDKKLSEETKNKLSGITPDSLFNFYSHSPSEFDVMNDWFFVKNHNHLKKTRFTTYYEKKGLTITNHMVEVVLRCYRLKLNALPVDHDKVLSQLKTRQQRHIEEDKVRYTTDSLRGFYIPKDIKDCFLSLDKIYIDSVKEKILKLTEKEYASGNHLNGIGKWMRTNWQLQEGSRLSKYFNELGIYHPEAMSGIIMSTYHRYLREENIVLEEKIEHYKTLYKIDEKYAS